MVPCPHMANVATLLKKMTPVTQARSAGCTNNAPTSTSEPRGSFTTALRKPSCCALKRSMRSATEPPPRSGPPSTTTRVGSPPVCESMTRTLCITLSRRTSRPCALHQCGHFGTPSTDQRQARRAHPLGAATHDLLRQLDRLDEIMLGVEVQQRHEPAV